MSATETAAEKATGRDARVDTIGLVQEMDRFGTKDLRTAVKVRMVEKELQLATGDFFVGKLGDPTMVGTIDPRKWHALWEEGAIDDDQYFGALSVENKAAGDAVGKTKVVAMSSFVVQAGRLTVVRRDGYKPELLEAVNALAERIEKKK